MSVSSRNLLQEYCQQKGIELPVYNTWLVKATPPHNPRFASSVSLERDYVESTHRSRKKDAEADAARAMLELRLSRETTRHSHESPHSDNENQTGRKYNPPGNPRAFLLIDLENVNNISLSELERRTPDDVYIMGFMSSNNHQYSNIKRLERYMQVFVVHSSVKDACDHLMTFVASGIFFSQPIPQTGREKKLLVVFTKDHVGGVMVELLRDRFHAFHVTRFEDLSRVWDSTIALGFV